MYGGERAGEKNIGERPVEKGKTGVKNGTMKGRPSRRKEKVIKADKMTGEPEGNMANKSRTQRHKRRKKKEGKKFTEKRTYLAKDGVRVSRMCGPKRGQINSLKKKGPRMLWTMNRIGKPHSERGNRTPTTKKQWAKEKRKNGRKTKNTRQKIGWEKQTEKNGKYSSKKTKNTRQMEKQRGTRNRLV